MSGPVPRSRTIFIYRDPEWTFLITLASRADHSLRERTFFYCLRGTRGQYLNRSELCLPRADLFVLADLLYVMCGPLFLAGGLFSFIGTPSGLFWSLAFVCGPFSPRADLFLLLAWHTWSVFYQTYGPQPAAFGPF